MSPVHRSLLISLALYVSSTLFPCSLRRRFFFTLSLVFSLSSATRFVAYSRTDLILLPSPSSSPPPPSYSCTLSLLFLLSLFLYVSPLLLLMHPGAKMRVAPCFFFSSILCTTFPSSAHVVGDISSLLAPLLFSHTRPFWRSGYRCYARRALRRSTNSHENYRRRPRRCPSGNWYLYQHPSLCSYTFHFTAHSFIRTHAFIIYSLQ